MKGIGIQLEQTGEGSVDLAVREGALAVGAVTEQNQWMLLTAHKGEIREWPLVGVGIGDMANDHALAEWEREVSSQLEEDGQEIERLKITSTSMDLKARYRE